MKVRYPHGGIHTLCTYRSHNEGTRLILSRGSNWRPCASTFRKVVMSSREDIALVDVIQADLVCPHEPFEEKVHDRYRKEDLQHVEHELRCGAIEVFHKTGVIPRGFHSVDYGVDSEIEFIQETKEELMRSAMFSGIFGHPKRKGSAPLGRRIRVPECGSLMMCVLDSGHHCKGIQLLRASPNPVKWGSGEPLFYFLKTRNVLKKSSTARKAFDSIISEKKREKEEQDRLWKQRQEENRRLRNEKELPRLLELCSFFGVYTTLSP